MSYQSKAAGIPCSGIVDAVYKFENKKIQKFLVSRHLKIEKVMRACDFYSLPFLQGQTEILRRE